MTSIPIRSLLSAEKYAEKCGFALTFQLIRGNRAFCTSNVQKMHVAICSCKAAANFATDQQPAPRRAYRLRYAELAPLAGPYLECKREQGAAAPGSYPNSRPAGHGHGCESVTDFS